MQNCEGSAVCTSRDELLSKPWAELMYRAVWLSTVEFAPALTITKRYDGELERLCTYP